MESAGPDEDYPKDYYTKLAKVEETIDQDCVKEKLNLPENGHKALLEVEAIILITSAKSKCIKNIFDFGEAFLNLVVQESQRTEDHVSCARYRLQYQESTTATLSSDENDEYYRCLGYNTDIDAYAIPEWAFERENESGCGAFSYDTIERISCRSILLTIEKDEELKKKNMKEVFKYASENLQKLADCTLARI